MIDTLQPFTKLSIHSQQEVAELYFELYDEADHTIGEYELDEDGMLQRVQFFMDEGTSASIAAQDATLIATQVVTALDQRALKLDTLISYDTHYLVIFEETDERYNLSLPNTGAHISINGDGQLLGATFFHEPYTVHYADNIISQQQATETLNTLPLMQLAVDTEHWRYTYVRDHYLLGLHVNGERYSIQDDGGLTIDYTSITSQPSGESLHEAMLNNIGQNIVVQQDKSIEGIHHYYVAQQDEDDAYTLDLSSFDEVDDDVLDFELDEQHRLVELQDDGIHLHDDVLRARAEQIVHALVGDEAVNYVLEETKGMDALLAASPFYEQMEAPPEKMYRFLYNMDGVYLHDKPIEISMHCSTALAVEVVHYDIPYDKLRALSTPAISLQQANKLAAEAATIGLAFMRTSIEDNMYDLAYLIDYPNSPTGGAIARIDAYDGTMSYVDADAEAQ